MKKMEFIPIGFLIFIANVYSGLALSLLLAMIIAILFVRHKNFKGMASFLGVTLIVGLLAGGLIFYPILDTPLKGYSSSLFPAIYLGCVAFASIFLMAAPRFCATKFTQIARWMGFFTTVIAPFGIIYAFINECFDAPMGTLVAACFLGEILLSILFMIYAFRSKSNPVLPN